MIDSSVVFAVALMTMNLISSMLVEDKTLGKVNVFLAGAYAGVAMMMIA